MDTNLTSHTPAYYEQVRTEMLQFVPTNTHTVLELGCSAGLFIKHLKETFPHIKSWGIELDIPAAQKAEQHIDTVLVGDVTELIEDLTDGSFDCIVGNDILEHLADPYTVLTMLKRKLTPNGCIVLSIPNVRYAKNLWNLMIQKNWRYEDYGVLDKTHLRFFTQKSLRETFETLGFSVVTITGINGFTTSWKFSVLNILSFGYLSDTAPEQFACVIRAN